MWNVINQKIEKNSKKKNNINLKRIDFDVCTPVKITDKRFIFLYNYGIFSVKYITLII